MLSTTLPQIFCKFILHFKDIFKSMTVADDTGRVHLQAWMGQPKFLSISCYCAGALDTPLFPSPPLTFSLSLSLPPSVYLLEAEEVTLTQKQDVEEDVTISLDKKEEKPKEGLFPYLQVVFSCLHVVSSFSHVCSHAFYVGVASLLCVIHVLTCIEGSQSFFFFQYSATWCQTYVLYFIFLKLAHSSSILWYYF